MYPSQWGGHLCCAIAPFAKLRRETDRDGLACMNILRCMAIGLAQRPSRPAHLQRYGDSTPSAVRFQYIGIVYGQTVN